MVDTFKKGKGCCTLKGFATLETNSNENRKTVSPKIKNSVALVKVLVTKIWNEIKNVQKDLQKAWGIRWMGWNYTGMSGFGGNI